MLFPGGMFRAFEFLLSLQAAAALCVGMGSFFDPFEAQGLAHFLGSLP